MLLKILISYSLEMLVSFSKTELRSILADTAMSFGADVSKYYLVKNVSDAMTNN